MWTSDGDSPYGKPSWVGSGSSILAWIPIRIQGFDDPKIGKNLQLKKNLIFFFIKNSKLPILWPPERKFKLQKKPSALKREHLALKNIKFLNFYYFCGSILPSWIRIRILNPGPLTWLNPDPFRIGNTGFTARGTAIWARPIVDFHMPLQSACF